MRQQAKWLICGAAFLLLAAPSLAQTQTSDSETPLGRVEGSLRDIGRHINNPIGPLWNLTFENAIASLDGGGLDDDLGYAGTFQTFMPMPLASLGLGRFAWARDLRFITQWTMPLVETVPLGPGPRSDQKLGFGDIQLAGVLAPSSTSGVLWGIGPTFIFPSASSDVLGQGKYQVGPAAVLGYLGSKWTAYAVAQQWWSFSGDDDRSSTRQLCLEYVLLRNLPDEWLVGMQPSIEVDWTRSSGSKILFPVGAGVGKTVRVARLPVQLWLEFDYYVVRPDDLSAPRWGIDIQIIPVIGEFF